METSWLMPSKFNHSANPGSITGSLSTKVEFQRMIEQCKPDLQIQFSWFNSTPVYSNTLSILHHDKAEDFSHISAHWTSITTLFFVFLVLFSTSEACVQSGSAMWGNLPSRNRTAVKCSTGWIKMKANSRLCSLLVWRNVTGNEPFFLICCRQELIV